MHLPSSKSVAMLERIQIESDYFPAAGWILWSLRVNHGK